ncbi:MAG TPA: histone deacetylase [Spirochaetota bacterium]|nr:histone deacetylase [Spirochaetota bacterium]
MGRTAYLFESIYLEHQTEWGHPESAERLIAIDTMLQSRPYYGDLVRVRPRKADIRHIELVHDLAYIRRAREEIESGEEYFDSMDTSVCPRSYEVALYAAGGALAICDAVMEGRAEYGFCALRPPGHHAERDYAAGFCIFNNIAIAARYIQKEHSLKRVAIVDWDVHHGNGTQHTFEKDHTVFYASLHQFPYYPGTGSGVEKGRDAGVDFTLNIPMDAGSGDEEYRAAFRNRLIPALEAFQPEFILISAGFDAHRNDPLAGMDISTGMFGEFTTVLMGVAARHAKNRVVALLEGGYNLNALAASVERMMRTFVEA